MHAGDASSIPGLEAPLEKEMATYSGILGWEIPWTEERPVIEADRGQALEVTVAARVVDVEPGRPLAGLCGDHRRWNPGRRRSGPINSCENPGLPTPISRLSRVGAWASPAFPDPEPSSTEGAAKGLREVVFLLQPP